MQIYNFNIHRLSSLLFLISLKRLEEQDEKLLIL
jgi:hypothetical protein